MLARSRRAAAILGACAATLLAIPGSAAATVTASQITSPASPALLVTDAGVEAGGQPVTVQGTTVGTGNVSLRCYTNPSTGTGGYVAIAEATVTANTFTASVPRTAFESANCVLRAVPVGDVASHPPAQGAPFQGPRVVTSSFSFSPTAAGPTGYTYDAVSSTLTGYMEFVSLGNCGLQNSGLWNTETLEENGGPFFCNAPLFEGDTTIGKRSDLQVDGVDSYSPPGLHSLEGKERLNHALPGGSDLTVTRAFDPATGLVTLHEISPIFRCVPETTAPPTPSSCTSVVSAGVQLERTWQTTNEDHLAWMTDTWRSTDGHAHTIKADYYQEFVDSPAGGAFLFPGTSSFTQTTSKGQTISLPQGAGTMLYKVQSTTPDAGDNRYPQGAVVYDSAPSEPLIVSAPSTANFGNAFVMPYLRTVPAGGTYTIRMAFVQAYGLAEVSSLAGSAAASYLPSISITSPGAGTLFSGSSSPVTVTGTASDSGALSSVTVNGQAAAVGPGGAWKASVSLTPGANTITAVATDQAGLSRSASVPVSYRRLVPGAVSSSKGLVTFTVACQGVPGSSCGVASTLTTVERRRSSHIIGIAARRPKTTSRTVTVGAASTSIPAGRTVKVTIRLNATGRSLLARFHRLPANLRIVLKGTPATTELSRAITVKPAPKRRH